MLGFSRKKGLLNLWFIFIGHGGAKVAEYVKQNLFSHLLRHPKFISDTKVAIGSVLFSFPLIHSYAELCEHN